MKHVYSKNWIHVVNHSLVDFQTQTMISLSVSRSWLEIHSTTGDL